MSKIEFTNRIEELKSKGWSAKAAERAARRERKLESPQHKAAMVRRLAMADARFERTGTFKF